jgi:signal recognition particle subunit SRP54
MFQGLGDRLQSVFDGLRGRGKLTEADVKAALREVRIALLEADVNLEVARDFVKRVQEKAIGNETLMSLRPDQRVVSIVHEELIEVLGGKASQPILNDGGNVWLLMGLQGAGKTTTAGKLAYKYKAQGRRPLLVAADTQRPAAREQLKVLGGQVGVPVLAVEDGESPERTRARLDEHLRSDFRDLVIVDTAGRLQIDEALMDELAELGERLQPSERILVVDAMTGQQSLPVATSFDERIGVSGLILSKLDGDARGGAALSAKHVTGKPIYFAGISEKIDGLEPFHPDRVAGRILGMGDVLTRTCSPRCAASSRWARSATSSR